MLLLRSSSSFCATAGRECCARACGLSGFEMGREAERASIWREISNPIYIDTYIHAYIHTYTYPGLRLCAGRPNHRRARGSSSISETTAVIRYGNTSGVPQHSGSLPRGWKGESIHTILYIYKLTMPCPRFLFLLLR